MSAEMPIILRSGYEPQALGLLWEPQLSGVDAMLGAAWWKSERRV